MYCMHHQNIQTKGMGQGSTQCESGIDWFNEAVMYSWLVFQVFALVGIHFGLVELLHSLRNPTHELTYSSPCVGIAKMEITLQWSVKKTLLDHRSTATSLDSSQIETYNNNIQCTHEVCKQTYSWGASAPLSYLPNYNYRKLLVVYHGIGQDRFQFGTILMTGNLHARNYGINLVK